MQPILDRLPNRIVTVRKDRGRDTSILNSCLISGNQDKCRLFLPLGGQVPSCRNPALYSR